MLDLPEAPIHNQSILDKRYTVNQAALKALNFVNTNARFPIDVYEIANALNMPVSVARLNPTGTATSEWISGAIRKQIGEDHPQVLLEKNQTEPRRRFTLAHEIAHYLAWSHGLKREDIRDSEFGDARFRHPYEGDSNSQEYFANSFAHFLLMPDFAVVRCMQAGMSFHQMCSFFGVSENSCRRRFSYFDLASQTFDQGIA